MVSQVESLGMVPGTPYEASARGKSSTRKTRGTPSAKKQQQQPVVPSTSARKTSARKQKAGRGGAPRQQPAQPSPEAIAHAGGLYFDMDGRPVFVEMKPAAFFGDALMRPFVKLDADNKPVKDRPCQPKLPNEPLLEWGKRAKWVKGGSLPPPSMQKQGQSGQVLKVPPPMKPRAAWQFYAEELIQQATNARDRFEGDDVAVRQLIINEVRGLDKKRHRWVMPLSAGHAAGTSKGGKWAQLSAVDQEKYIKMHNEDVKRYDDQMEAWQRMNPEQHSKAAELSMRRNATRKAQAEEESLAQQQQQQQQEGEEQQPQQEAEIAGSAGDVKRKGNKRQKLAGQEQAGEQHKADGKQSSKKQKRGRRNVEEEEAEEGHSDEEDEVYQSESSEDEDYLDADSEQEEDVVQQQPARQQKKASPPGRKVLSNANSKLNTPPKASKGVQLKAGAPSTIGGVATKQSSPFKQGGVVAKSIATRASVRAK